MRKQKISLKTLSGAATIALAIVIMGFGFFRPQSAFAANQYQSLSADGVIVNYQSGTTTQALVYTPDHTFTLSVIAIRVPTSSLTSGGFCNGNDMAVYVGLAGSVGGLNDYLTYNDSYSNGANLNTQVPDANGFCRFIVPTPTVLTAGITYHIYISDDAIYGNLQQPLELGYGDPNYDVGTFVASDLDGMLEPTMLLADGSIDTGWSSSGAVINSQDRNVLVSYSPTYGSTTASTTVTLSSTWRVTDAVSAIWSLGNTDTGQQYTFTAPFSGTGVQTVQKTETLSAGLYIGTLTSSGNVNPSDSALQSFIVVSSNTSDFAFYGSSSQNIIASASMSGTSFCTATSSSDWFQPIISFGCRLIIPDPSTFVQFSTLAPMLQAKIPFSYFYTVQSELSSTTLNTASTSLPILVIQNATSSPFHYNLVMFSPSLLNKYFSPDAVSAFQLLTSLGLGLEFLWYLYHRIKYLLQPHV